MEILNVTRDENGIFHAVNPETGTEVTGDGAPRQIMMFLADKNGQQLYRKNKKWRRASAEKLVPKTPAVATA